MSEETIMYQNQTITYQTKPFTGLIGSAKQGFYFSRISHILKTMAKIGNAEIGIDGLKYGYGKVHKTDGNVYHTLTYAHRGGFVLVGLYLDDDKIKIDFDLIKPVDKPNRLCDEFKTQTFLDEVIHDNRITKAKIPRFRYLSSETRTLNESSSKLYEFLSDQHSKLLEIEEVMKRKRQ